MMTTVPICFNSLLLPSFHMLVNFFSFMLTVGGLWLFIIFPWLPHYFRQDDIHFFAFKATSFQKQSLLIGKKSFVWESSQIYFAVFSFKEDLNIDWVPFSNHNKNSRNKSICLVETTNQISKGSQRCQKYRTRSSKSRQSQRLAEQKEHDQRSKRRNQVGN